MTKRRSNKVLDAYYADGDSWSRSKQDDLRKSRTIAWLVAGLAAIVAVCEAFALMLLTPLKTVEPYTLLVDRQTGFVQQLKPLDPERVSADAALTQSFLVQYVLAREGFDIDSVQSDYRKVGLWSTDSARSEYIGAMQASNSESPLVRYPRSTLIETKVKSVSPVGRDTALVRFETRRRDAGGQGGTASAWVALIKYRYSGEPMSIDDRFVNPLGFQVVRYRRNAETLPEVAPTPTPTPAPYALQQPLQRAPVSRQGPAARPTPEVEL
ncbi:MAG: VirB8/TrbF family protein [Pseudomonadota bacterium]